MIYFAILDNDGYPTGGGSRPSLPNGAVALPPETSTADLTRLRYQSGAWLERPQLPQPVASANGFDVTDLPPDAQVEVTDMGSGASFFDLVFDGVAVGRLPEQGTFLITVTAPRPWLEASLTVIRGAGSAVLAARALDAARVVAVDRINTTIGDVRKRFVTDIPGQEALYLEKRDEAVAYLDATPEPANLADYALLASEVGITAPTAYQLAQVWINRAHLFRLVGGLTETLRMTAINAVTAAPDDAAIAAALEAFEHSLTAIPQT